MTRSLLLLLAAILVTAGAHAQSQLRARLSDNSPINVSVNGRYFDKRGTTITVGDLPAGRHYLKMYTVAFDRYGRAYERVVYQGTVHTFDGMLTNVTYDPYARRMRMNPQYLDDYNRPTNNIHRSQDQYRSGVDDGSESYASGREREEDKPKPAAADNDDVYKPSATPVASPVADNDLSSLTEKETNTLHDKVTAKSTDTEKMKVLKDALKRETITTLQVSVMMDWLLFESTRVEFAKWAYSITADKEYYKDLAGKFEYKSSKEELEDFLKGK